MSNVGRWNAGLESLARRCGHQGAALRVASVAEEQAGDVLQARAATRERPDSRRRRRATRARAVDGDQGARGDLQLPRGVLPLAIEDRRPLDRLPGRLRRDAPGRQAGAGRCLSAAVHGQELRHRLHERRHRARRQSPAPDAVPGRVPPGGAPRGLRGGAEPVVPVRPTRRPATRSLAAASGLEAPPARARRPPDVADHAGRLFPRWSRPRRLSPFWSPSTAVYARAAQNA